MMRTLIALVAAIIVATTVEVPRASAGVRIGFGFPIGAMMATPSHKHSYNRGHHRSRAASSVYKKKKSIAASRAHRARIAEAQRQRAIARANARAAAKIAAAKAAAKASAATTDDPVEEKTEDAATTTTTTTYEPTPLAPAPITPPGGPVATTVEPAMVQTTATMSVPDKPAATEKSEPAPSKKADCKKFVASVGLTITVPCN